MISLHILKLLEDHGFGTIDTDLFFENIPVDQQGVAQEGVWIVERGGPASRFDTRTQAFDIYSRYNKKTLGYQKLDSILSFLQEAYGEVCNLPSVPPYSDIEYTNVRLIPTSNVENVGTDENNKIVRVISGEITYERIKS